MALRSGESMMHVPSIGRPRWRPSAGGRVFVAVDRFEAIPGGVGYTGGQAGGQPGGRERNPPAVTRRPRGVRVHVEDRWHQIPALLVTASARSAASLRGWW